MFLARRDAGAGIGRDDLAASLHHTGNARVRRDIQPYEMSAVAVDSAPAPFDSRAFRAFLASS